MMNAVRFQGAFIVKHSDLAKIPKKELKAYPKTENEPNVTVGDVLLKPNTPGQGIDTLSVTSNQDHYRYQVEQYFRNLFREKNVPYTLIPGNNPERWADRAKEYIVPNFVSEVEVNRKPSLTEQFLNLFQREKAL